MADNNKFPELPEIDMSILESSPLFSAIQALSASAQQKADALLADGQLNEGIDGIDLNSMAQEMLTELSPEHLATLLDEADELPPEE